MGGSGSGGSVFSEAMKTALLDPGLKRPFATTIASSISAVHRGWLIFSICTIWMSSCDAQKRQEYTYLQSYWQYEDLITINSTEVTVE